MKRNITKSIWGSFLAAMMLTLPCGTAYADTNVDTTVTISDTMELTDIGGYACYQRDGNYWTMLNGEECLVIDLRDKVTTHSSVSTTDAQGSDFSYPSFWGNKTCIPLSTKISYKDQIDLSYGDYYSPIFELSHFGDVNNAYMELSTNHIVNNSYDIEIYSKSEFLSNWWDITSAKITFNIFGKSRVIWVGSSSSIDVDYVGIRFLSSSTGRDDFECTFTQYKNS